ncbi:MAG: hypothetical protein ACRD29_23520 [Acidimicrobiales bacterium]
MAALSSLTVLPAGAGDGTDEGPSNRRATATADDESGDRDGRRGRAGHPCQQRRQRQRPRLHEVRWHAGGVEIYELELARRFPGSVGSEAEEESKRVPIGGDGMRAHPALAGETIGEEGLEQRRE